MESVNLLRALEFSDEQVVIVDLLESRYYKEIGIAMQPHQSLREHQSPMPIVLEVVRGKIRIGLDTLEYELEEGDLFEIPAEKYHHIIAIEASLLRLSLHQNPDMLEYKA